jgi:hypothetical protein
LNKIDKFDRVMAIFRVLPTSDQIQMLAKYRPDCPWDIYLSETIQVSGNECNGSTRKLSRSMEDEGFNSFDDFSAVSGCSWESLESMGFKGFDDVGWAGCAEGFGGWC